MIAVSSRYQADIVIASENDSVLPSDMQGISGVGKARFPKYNAVGNYISLNNNYSHYSYEKAMNTAMHEFGHTFGLHHTNASCHTSRRIETTLSYDSNSVMNASASK